MSVETERSSMESSGGSVIDFKDTSIILLRPGRKRVSTSDPDCPTAFASDSPPFRKYARARQYPSHLAPAQATSVSPRRGLPPRQSRAAGTR